jgi:predicted butyrate kinase (DUF1464 family)
MPEARQLAAQCWCDVETEKIEMDTALAEAVAKRIAAWMSSAAEFSNNAEFYRGIVHKIGDHFGAAARTSDDGSVQDHVLALKVPELVDQAIRSRSNLRNALAMLVGATNIEDLRTMEAVIRLQPIPAQDKANIIDAIHALIASA